MSNLVAKVMSREPMPDSDSRKTFKIIPVPRDHEVEFQRTEISGVVNMLFTALYGDARGTMIPLKDCGKIYLLQDGKTVSTFDPEPRTLPRMNVQGEVNIKMGNDTMVMQGDTISLQGPGFKTAQPVCQVINVRDTETYKQARYNLDLLAPNGIYPWAGRWNDVIAQVVAVGHYTVTLVMTNDEALSRDSEAVNRYFNRVANALLNTKSMIGLSYSPGANGSYNVIFSERSGVVPEQNLAFTQTHKQILTENKVSGLLTNLIQRAVKLLNHGGDVVIATPKLKVEEHEIDIVKNLFRNAFDYVVKFSFDGEVLSHMTFNKVTRTSAPL